MLRVDVYDSDASRPRGLPRCVGVGYSFGNSYNETKRQGNVCAAAVLHSLLGEIELPVAHDAGEVMVEEVGVDERLDGPGAPLEDEHAALHEVAVDPVEDVEDAVPAKGHQVVVRKHIAATAGGLEKPQLGEDSNGLKPLREGEK